jgi:hypothetical protein
MNTNKNGLLATANENYNSDVNNAQMNLNVESTANNLRKQSHTMKQYQQQHTSSSNNSNSLLTSRRSDDQIQRQSAVNFATDDDEANAYSRIKSEKSKLINKFKLILFINFEKLIIIF